MTIISPKCRHIRQVTYTAPAWQCPACGVAYAKAADALRVPALPMTPLRANSAQVHAGLLCCKPLEKRRMAASAEVSQAQTTT